jgi:predicted unusual protein kinase regulating ubiquinone biosynthesis (AarF/ABC1/UbiB family)
MAKGDENSLGGRVRRYARVTTSVGGLAARLAGERILGLDLDRNVHAADLRRALGGLKGPLMKVAQLLSTIPEALPQEYVAELAQLQANAPAMGIPFVRRRMAGELGAGWESRFRSFDPVAAAAASLGQVHRAVSLDGRDLACKLQYPDMASVVEADLRQLKLVFSIYRRYDDSIDTTDVHAEIAERLREELDYDREARHMALYGALLADRAEVHVPVVETDLSTRRLLTMSWLDGKRLLDYSDAPLETRNRLALNLFHAWYEPFYRGGVIHADPHLGNYTARDDLTINLLDFGCIRIFRAEFVQGVIDLYWAIANDDRDLAVHAYETWGVQQPRYGGSRHTEPLGRVRLRSVAREPAPPHPGVRFRRFLRSRRRRQGSPPVARTRRREAAPGVRVHGPCRHRPRRGVPPSQGRGELARTVPWTDRRLRRPGAPSATVRPAPEIRYPASLSHRGTTKRPVAPDTAAGRRFPAERRLRPKD